ncbi:MAG: hypothetical protein LBV23_07105 [Deltaproteobacteria bacterium]|jgi:hypothetical protein|nr:hypothetical protein [Deltaproteobacteria bacterium]
MAVNYFPNALQILNYFYLCKNVHTFAKAYFKINNSAIKDILTREWSIIICEKIKSGKLKEVLNKIEKICITHKITPNLYNYLINNINIINYPEYISKNYFIGSGEIESANKVVLQSRLKRPSQRWNIETAQYMIEAQKPLKRKVV